MLVVAEYMLVDTEWLLYIHTFHRTVLELSHLLRQWGNWPPGRPAASSHSPERCCGGCVRDEGGDGRTPSSFCHIGSRKGPYLTLECRAYYYWSRGSSIQSMSLMMIDDNTGNIDYAQKHVGFASMYYIKSSTMLFSIKNPTVSILSTIKTIFSM